MNAKGGSSAQRKQENPLPPIGWHESVALPELGVERIKVEVDTGAQSPALHAFNVEEFERDGETWVRFDLHPLQRDSKTSVEAEARLVKR